MSLTNVIRLAGNVFHYSRLRSFLTYRETSISSSAPRHSIDMNTRATQRIFMTHEDDSRYRSIEFLPNLGQINKRILKPKLCGHDSPRTQDIFTLTLNSENRTERYQIHNLKCRTCNYLCRNSDTTDVLDDDDHTHYQRTRSFDRKVSRISCVRMTTRQSVYFVNMNSSSPILLLNSMWLSFDEWIRILREVRLVT